MRKYIFTHIYAYIYIHVNMRRSYVEVVCASVCAGFYPPLNLCSQNHNDVNMNTVCSHTVCSVCDSSYSIELFAICVIWSSSLHAVTIIEFPYRSAFSSIFLYIYIDSFLHSVKRFACIKYTKYTHMYERIGDCVDKGSPIRLYISYRQAADSYIR